MKQAISTPDKKRLIVGITGASGAIYGVRLTQALLAADYEVHLIVSPAGYQVLAHEMGITDAAGLTVRLLEEAPAGMLVRHAHDDIAAVTASGSFQTEGMVIAPCSMGTLAAVSQGLAQNLMTRSADVCLKERRPLILMTRETPLHTIHLENMLRLSRLGATILPAMPAFYHHPETLSELVDFMVGRALDVLHIPHTRYTRYSGLENDPPR